jgi:hypothetical protein
MLCTPTPCWRVAGSNACSLSVPRVQTAGKGDWAFCFTLTSEVDAFALLMMILAPMTQINGPSQGFFCKYIM